MNIAGLRTKNLTFSAKVGQRQYRLSEQQSIGIPEKNLILGFSMRFNYDGDNYKSVNGRRLINVASLVASSLTLRGFGTKTFLADANLWNFSNLPDYLNLFQFNDFSPYQGFIQPTPANEISWTKSTISISFEGANINITDEMDFEIIVYHCSPDFKQFEKLLPPITQTYLGKQLQANYHTTIQINTKSAIVNPTFSTIPLTFDGKSGIDSNSIIYGVRAMQFVYQSFDGKITPAVNTFGSAFFDLKKGDTLLLDKVPYLNLCSNRALNIPYLPIEPTPAYLIDWQGSQMFITDNSNSSEDMCFLIQFFYHFQQDIVENLDI